jgi:hypothetical protein
MTAAALVAVAATAGCGSDGDDPVAAEPVAPVGRPVAGSVVQFADCADWAAGTRAERLVTVQRLRGQLTPQRSRTARSPLSDESAYAMLDKACTPRFSRPLRLYKLYVRMQAFAPLSEG